MTRHCPMCGERTTQIEPEQRRSESGRLLPYVLNCPHCSHEFSITQLNDRTGYKP